MTRILGIDPGLATGMAIYDTDAKCLVSFMDETPRGIHGFKPYFLTALKSVDHVACENFTLRSSNKFTADLHGVEIIGWLKGEDHWAADANPEPSQHMKLNKLGEKDKKADSPITHMMKAAGFPIGKGHTRMALSVAVWYAAMRLKHLPTLELLKPKDN